jgi:microcin C transport system permease protein
VQSYFIRRLLLIPPTLVGITLLVYIIMRLIPGGPMEGDLRKIMGQGDQKGTKRKEQSEFTITPFQLLELTEKHNQHKSPIRSYFEWLGVAPRDNKISSSVFEKNSLSTEVKIPGTIYSFIVDRNSENTGIFTSVNQQNTSEWKIRIQSPEDQLKQWRKYVPNAVSMPKETPYRAVIFQSEYDGLLQGSLGISSKYQESVTDLIISKIPISLFYGIFEIILLYSICLPLGIIKAIKHRTWIDNISSIIVFAGYAIPGYALGALLMIYCCATWRWFPIGGFTSDDFAALSLTGKIYDLFYHAAMPMLCYMVGSFALMTMMMKNSLMDNLAADYVRTAIAKGVSFPGAIFKHAFRNSFIPIATTLGGIVGIFVSGSMLIERIFDINGIGLLQYNALLERDEPIIMGTLVIAAFLMLLGNVLSDLAVAIVDPKISFE